MAARPHEIPDEIPGQPHYRIPETLPAIDNPGNVL
jgi:hypothetical protein